jgi:hypothetical protein
MIAMAMGQHAELEIFMPVTHVLDGIHDDVRVGVRCTGVDQNNSVSVAGKQKRFHHAALADGNPAGNDFDSVDGNVLEYANHHHAPLRVS